MARIMTLRDAFAYFNGAKGTNTRWSWSARSPDGRTVVVTLWDDMISDDGKTVIADVFGNEYLHSWRHKPGNKERIENLKWAREHCDNLFNVVMITPKARRARPRSIARRYPHPTLVMKLIGLDEETGEFRAESVAR